MGRVACTEKADFLTPAQQFQIPLPEKDVILLPGFIRASTESY